MQEVLLTGGIHTNMFKTGEYEVSIIVNDEDTMR